MVILYLLAENYSLQVLLWKFCSTRKNSVLPVLASDCDISFVVGLLLGVYRYWNKYNVGLYFFNCLAYIFLAVFLLMLVYSKYNLYLNCQPFQKYLNLKCWILTVKLVNVDISYIYDIAEVCLSLKKLGDALLTCLCNISLHLYWISACNTKECLKERHLSNFCSIFVL